MSEKHPFYIAAQAFSTENTSERPIIDGISPFQILRIHTDSFLQYFPGPWAVLTCSGISRCRNSTLRYAKTASIFLYEDIVRSVLNSVIEQILTPSIHLSNFGATAPLLP